jgi:ribosomal protein L32E
MLKLRIHAGWRRIRGQMESYAVKSRHNNSVKDAGFTSNRETSRPGYILS